MRGTLQRARETVRSGGDKIRARQTTVPTFAVFRWRPRAGGARVDRPSETRRGWAAGLGPAVTACCSPVGTCPSSSSWCSRFVEGRDVVAQTSLIGASLANGMLVPGLRIGVGARQESQDGVMRFGTGFSLGTPQRCCCFAASIIVILGFRSPRATKGEPQRHGDLGLCGAGCNPGVYVQGCTLRSARAAANVQAKPRVPLCAFRRNKRMAVGDVG